MSYLGLPPIPPDLKPISSYLQRAHETRTQDPVISYWCAYYAAQVGIALRVVSTPNRNFLAALLTTLENLRSTVGSSDAITVESASSAYVEDFALRVFTSADNEDRRGAATRKTAKKYLAAATFFEVLNVFEDRGPWDAHEEKVRYAKWRAAEISKALREGRQPTPVPAGGGESAEIAIIDDPLSAPPITPPPPESSDAPHTRVSHELEEPYDEASTAWPPAFTAFGEGDAPPLEINPRSAPVPINGGGAEYAALPARSPPSPPSSVGSSTSKSRRRHQADSRAPPPEAPQQPPPPPPSIPQQAPSPPRGSPTSSLRRERGRGASLGTASLTSSPSPTTRTQRPASPTHFVPRGSPPSTVPYLTGPPYASAPPLPPPPLSVPYVQLPPPPSAPYVPPRLEPPELTPGLIAKAQKHCRFAISALDYEDAEQARKELRSALAILGG